MLLLRIARNAIRIYYAKKIYACLYCCFCNESNCNSQGSHKKMIRELKVHNLC